MSKFFILGLPRSRTYWLSEFLGCMHEGYHYYPNYSEFMNSNYIGDSTTCYPWIKDYIKNYKKVVIERDIEEVFDSSVRLFPHVDIETLYDMKIELDEIEDCLRIDYQDINKKLPEIWEYCIGTEYDKNRAQKLMSVKLENYPLIQHAQQVLNGYTQ